MSFLKGAKSKATRPIRLSTKRLTAAFSGRTTGVVVGEIVECNVDGTISVDYAGNTDGPVRARTLIEDLFVGAKVLLVFELGLPPLPIILGIVHERVFNRGRTMHLKADQIILDATEGVTVRCGEACFEAHRSGKVCIKGRDISSRARRTNKVRGAQVLMN
jgi:hypothetical protein